MMLTLSNQVKRGETSLFSTLTFRRACGERLEIRFSLESPKEADSVLVQVRMKACCCAWLTWGLARLPAFLGMLLAAVTSTHISALASEAELSWRFSWAP